MKTIVANLKLNLNLHSWLFGFSLVILVYFNVQIMSDHKLNDQIIIGSFMCLPFFLGFLASVVLIEVMNKPFSFCLPGHKQNVKKVLIITAVLVGFFFAFLLCFLLFGGLKYARIIPIFFANLVFFLLGAELNMFARNIFALLFMMTFFLFTYNHPYEFLGGFILQHSLSMICIGLGGSITTWLLLDSPGLARRFCDNPKWTGFINFWNIEKVRRLDQFREASRKEKSKLKIKPSVEEYFLNKMKGHKFFSTGRYIWGGLYQAFGLSFSNFNPASLLFLAPFIFLFCYWPQYFWMMFLMLPIMMAMILEIPVYSSMMISNGRNERFNSALVTSLVKTGFIIVQMTIIIIFSKLAGLFMPDLELFNETFIFQTLGFQFSFLPLIAVPIVQISKLLFHKKFSWTVFLIMFFYIFFIMSINPQRLVEKNMNLNEFLILNLYSVVYFILIWITFVLVLRHICFKRSLL